MNANEMYLKANNTLFQAKQSIREGNSTKEVAKIFSKYAKEYLKAYKEAKENGYKRVKRVKK